MFHTGVVPIQASSTMRDHWPLLKISPGYSPSDFPTLPLVRLKKNYENSISNPKSHHNPDPNPLTPSDIIIIRFFTFE